MKKVLVVHPGKQHSLQTAYGLEVNGMLYKYITTVYDKKGSITNLVTKFLKGDSKKKALGRKNTKLDDEKIIQFCEVRGLICISLSKIPFLQKLYFWWNDYLNDCFGKKIAKYAIKNNIDMVISYDFNSTVLFSILKQKAPNIIKILDVSIANRIYLRNIFENDLVQYPESKLKIEHSDVWSCKAEQRMLSELENTDYFLVPSQFVKDSLIYSGIPEQRIKVVPYGVDNEKFSFNKQEKLGGELKLLYVGGITYRKGLHHLLNVIKDFDCKDVTLKLAGAYDIDNDIYQKYKNIDNIEFLGFVTRDSLADLYDKSDVFVLASLGEGMALVGLEAISSGLPLICSNATGINDVVKEGGNGFVFPVGDDKALRKIIQWFVDNPDKIYKMGLNARYTAQEMSWQTYYANLAKTVENLI